MARFDFPSAPTAHSLRPSGSFPGAQQHREKVRVVRHYTASEDFLAPAGVTDVLYTLQGGGAGGGGSDGTSWQGASGGAGGETVTGVMRVTPGERYTITVGAGGSGGAGGFGGNPGGASTIIGQGVSIRANGGRAGTTLGAAATPTGVSGESFVHESHRFAGGAGGAGGITGNSGLAGGSVDGHAGGAGGAPAAGGGGGGGGGATPFGAGGNGGNTNSNGQAAPQSSSGAGGGGGGGSDLGVRAGGAGSGGFIRLVYDE